MYVWHHLEEFPGGFAHPVVTIGNFDGVHLGHQEILRETRRRAAQAGGVALVLTFDPHPLRILAPERAPRLLTPLPEKLRLLEQAGVFGVMAAQFTRDFSMLAPEEFVRQVLVERLGPREVVVGDNFRFGYRHAGDVRLLAELGRQAGFTVHDVAPVRVRGGVVSSSRIRDLLAGGRVPQANRLLGRCFSVRGYIVPGRGLGRAITVPTLNMEHYSEVLPAGGVYITETACDGVRSSSVTNIGHAPTFDGQHRELRLESFLLEATPPESAESMEVFFWRRLRDERKFPSPEHLKGQIMRDVERAQTFFRRLRSSVRR